MAYTYSLDNIDYLIKIKDIRIDVQQEYIGIIVTKISITSYVISEVSIHISGIEFNGLCAEIPIGSSLYDVIKIAAWEYIKVNSLEQVILGRPLDADEVLPTLTEVA